MIKIQRILTPRLLGAAIAAAALITPAIAFAQEAPSYADGGANQQIHGTIYSINGTWNISVADANGYKDSVELQQGTIINPTGLTLEPGMNVTIDGFPNGSTFDAIEIDTPYQYQGPPPVAVYYGPGAWYPGYAFGYGPSFSLSFNLGNDRFQQRSFSSGGQIRHAMIAPSGFANRSNSYSSNGYKGNAGFARAPQQQPARSYAAPQQQQARSFAAPQQQARSFAAPASRAAAAPRGTQGGGDRHHG